MCPLEKSNGHLTLLRFCVSLPHYIKTAFRRRLHILGVGLAEAEAWTLFSEGKHEEAVARLRSMSKFEKDHPMYYADILPRPTGEMLGDMLLQMNRPADALLAYKEALELAPNRLDSLAGASKAADLAGHPSESKEYVLRIKTEGGLLAPRPQ